MKILFVIFCFLLLVVPACQRRELSNLGVISITTIDWDPAHRQFVVGLGVQKQVVKGEESNTGDLWIGTASGNTISEALENMRARLPMHLTWQSSKLVLIGEEAARSKMEDMVDFLVRDSEVRLSGHMVTTMGNAWEVLMVKPDGAVNIAEQITYIIRRHSDEFEVFNISMYQVMEQFYKKHAFFITPLIFMEKPVPDNQELNGTVYLAGSALYGQRKLIGILNEMETRGYLWLNGKMKGAMIAYHNDSEQVTVEVNASQAVLRRINSSDPWAFEVSLRIRAILVEYVCPQKLNLDHIKELEKKLSIEVEKEMDAFVKKAYKKWMADPLLLGELVQRTEDENWNKIREQWYTMIAGLSMDKDVETRINRIGFINDSIRGR